MTANHSRRRKQHFVIYGQKSSRASARRSTGSGEVRRGPALRLRHNSRCLNMIFVLLVLRIYLNLEHLTRHTAPDRRHPAITIQLVFRYACLLTMRCWPLGMPLPWHRGLPSLRLMITTYARQRTQHAPRASPTQPVGRRHPSSRAVYCEAACGNPGCWHTSSR